jgi:hypothetical protein
MVWMDRHDTHRSANVGGAAPLRSQNDFAWTG